MKPTRASHLVILAAVGALVGWLAEMMLVTSGRASFIPPFTLGAALGLIALLVVLLALPVRKVARGVAGASVDPFYATRIVLLAKASSLAGALASGIAASILVFLLTRSVVAAAASVGLTIVMIVGSVLLLAGGLVAERMCTLPPPDDRRDGGLPDRVAS